MSPPGSTPVGSEALISSIVFFLPKQTCSRGRTGRERTSGEGPATTACEGGILGCRRTVDGLATVSPDGRGKGCLADRRDTKRHWAGLARNHAGCTCMDMLLHAYIIVGYE